MMNKSILILSHLQSVIEQELQHKTALCEEEKALGTPLTWPSILLFPCSLEVVGWGGLRQFEDSGVTFVGKDPELLQLTTP